MPSYKDKLRPVSTSTPSYAAKLKPVTPTAPAVPAKPNIRDIGAGLSRAATKVTNALGLGGAVDTIGSNLANVGNVLDPRSSLDQKVARSKELPQTNLKQNVGTGIQLGAIVAAPAAGAPASVGSAIGAGALLGGSQTGGQSLADNDPLTTVAKKTAVGAGVGGAVGGITKLAGNFLERLGDKIQYSVIKPTKPDLDDGFTINTVKKYDLGGSLTTVFKKTETKMDELTMQLNTKLGSSPERIKLTDVYAATAKRLEGGKYSGFGANTSIGNALKQLEAEIINVGDDLPLTDAQVVKRAAGHFGAWQYGMFDPDSTARQKVYNVFYNELKKTIEQKSPEGIRAINKQLSELIPVMNAVIRRIPIAERNNAISLTDVIGLVGSAIDPRALGVTLVNILSKSGTVGNALSRIGPKIGPTGPMFATGASMLPNALGFSPTTPQSPAPSSPVPKTSPKPTTPLSIPRPEVGAGVQN